MFGILVILGAVAIAAGTWGIRRQAGDPFVRIHEFTQAMANPARPTGAWTNLVVMVGTVVFLLGAMGSSITAAV